MLLLLLLLLLLSCCCCFSPAQAQDACRAPGGQRGQCLALLQCPLYVNIIKDLRAGRLPPSAYRRLTDATCAYRAGVPLLCCPGAHSAQPTQRPPQPQPPRIPQSHISPLPPTSPLLPQRCGESADPDRIVGGEEAALGAYPWIALLYGRESPASEASFICGGSLITSRYVVTAAHCIQYDGAISVVRLGEHRVSRNRDCVSSSRGQLECAPPPQDIRPAGVVLHPGYGSPGCLGCDDIALIRLSVEPRITRYVSPVCLPLDPERQMGYSVREFEGKFATAAGWGSINKSQFDVLQSDALQQATLQLQRCRQSTKKILCVRVKDKDTCKGDSGGPLMLKDGFGQKLFLVGITSTGNRVCATTSSTYTDVYRYVSWILDNISP